MTICLFEDEQFQQFFPLTYLRPVATLRAGIVPLFERVHRYFPQARLVLVVRDEIGPLTAHMCPSVPVNIIKRDESEDVLFINGRIRNWGDMPQLIQQARSSTRFVNDQMNTVALLFRSPLVNHTSKVTTPSEYVALYEREGDDIPDSKTTATLFGYLWDLVANIDEEIREDFKHLEKSKNSEAIIHPGAYIVNPDSTFLGDSVVVMPGAMMDASAGPVYIGANTRVEAHAAIYGPSAIGPNCIVSAGKYGGVSIGHTCRLGGEIEESIFQSYVNKHHAGFIGHSYVGSWVNFGAMTTNSDLKNNYSTIRVQSGGVSRDTGSIKVGSFIGDHTKFGIGTLLNTGIVIGVGCNIFGGSLVTDKEVPSFRWGNSSGWETHQFEKAVDTASRTVERRKQKLSDQELAQLKRVSEGSISTAGCLRFS